MRDETAGGSAPDCNALIGEAVMSTDLSQFLLRVAALIVAVGLAVLGNSIGTPDGVDLSQTLHHRDKADAPR
jgi:hypothetical protein